MAHEIKIDVFTIKIKKKRKAELMSFASFFKEDKNDPNKLKGFKAFFTTYVKSFGDSFAANKEFGKAVNITKSAVKFDSGKDIIYGIAEGGTTGVGSVIRNRKNISKGQTYSVTRDKVNAMPHYFMLWTPKNSNIGLLILQSFGSKSINDIYKDRLKDFFAQVCDDATLVFGNHVPKEAIEKMKNNPVINEVILRKYDLPSSKGEKLLGVNYAHDKNINVEIKITGLKSIPEMGSRIKDYLAGTITQLIDVEELDEIGFDGNHETLLRLEHNGKTALGKMETELKISPAYYVDKNDVKVDSNLHPNFESMHNYCLSFLGEMQTEIGYKIT